MSPRRRSSPDLPAIVPMDSTVFDGHHYDPQTQRLTLQFKSGKVWQYEGVPMEKAEAFAGNSSPGAFFGQKIKSLYPGREIG